MVDIAKKYSKSVPEDIVKIITPLGNKGAITYFKEELGATATVEDMFFELEEYLHPQYRDNILLKNGVFDYLSMLKNKGYSLNVLTASPHSNVDPCLKRNGIFDMFDNIWSNDDFGLPKSNVLIYDRVVEKLGTIKSDVLFFDDNFVAIQTAKKAGLNTVAVYDKTGEDFKSQLKETANRYINSFEELLK